MVLKRKNTVALMISIVCAISFGWIIFLVNGNKIVQFDDRIISFLQRLESSSLTAVMKVFTLMHDKLQVGIISILILIVLAVVLRYRSELILYLWVLIGSVVLNQVFKPLFERARPDVNQMVDVTGFSFPSGHAMMALSLYGVLAYLIWRHLRTLLSRIILLFIIAMIILLIGVSRIYLGVHYPSDILAGFLVSGCWLALSIWLYERIKS